jgi:hypothetical protein
MEEMAGWLALKGWDYKLWRCQATTLDFGPLHYSDAGDESDEDEGDQLMS